MEHRGYIIFNGFQLANADTPALVARFQKRFEELDTEGKGSVSGEQAKGVFNEEAWALLLPGVDEEFATPRLKNAFQAELQAELDKDTYVTVLQESLAVLSKDLEEKPIAASKLDGSVIQEVLDDAEGFTEVAEGLFENLDVDEDGKISRSELEPALLQIGYGLGVPTPDESQGETVLDELFGKHGTPESQEIGKDQFAALLRDLLVFLGDFLAKNPVLKVRPGLDPNRMTKTEVLEEIMADEAKVNEVTEQFFLALDVNKDGVIQKEEIKPLFLIESDELPEAVAQQKAAREIDNVFPDDVLDVPGQIDKDTFKDWMACVLGKYTSNAKAKGYE